MKLTLEHLCAYLPHKPQMIFRKSGRIIELNGLWVNENGNLILVDQFGEDWLLKHWNFKPILRHPSCITKEIEHRGERFVPMEQIDYFYRCHRDELPSNYASEYIRQVNEGTRQYNTIQLLHSWMIDTSGLIEAGLAIDVETLEYNPYAK